MKVSNTLPFFFFGEDTWPFFSSNMSMLICTYTVFGLFYIVHRAHEFSVHPKDMFNLVLQSILTKYKFGIFALQLAEADLDLLTPY